MDPVDPLANSGRLDFAAIYNEFGTFPRKVRSNFEKIQQTPQGSPRRAKGTPRAPQDAPKRTKGTPKDGQMGPKGTQKGAKGSQRAPKGSQRAPTGSQKERKGTQKGARGSPKSAPRKPKGQDLYFKLPINRPSGRYVINIHLIAIPAPWCGGQTKS